MDYKEVEKIINKIIKDFCFRFNVYYLYDDLKSLGNECYLKCKGKFKNGNFKNYFITALKNDITNFLKKELKYESRMIFVDDLERIGTEVREKSNLINKIPINILTEEELGFLNLLRSGYRLKEISNKLNISYERVKDIWSEIKAKLNPKKKSRRKIRKEWRERNPDYFKEWKRKNPDYYKFYFRIKRLVDRKEEIFLCVEKIFDIFCSNKKRFKSWLSKEGLRIGCVSCESENCLAFISHIEFLRKNDIEKFNFILLFSQLRCLKEVDECRLEIKREESFIGDNLIFIVDNLCDNFKLIKSSKKRFFMLIKKKN